MRNTLYKKWPILHFYPTRRVRVRMYGRVGAWAKNNTEQMEHRFRTDAFFVLSIITNSTLNPCFPFRFLASWADSLFIWFLEQSSRLNRIMNLEKIKINSLFFIHFLLVAFAGDSFSASSFLSLLTYFIWTWNYDCILVLFSLFFLRVLPSPSFLTILWKIIDCRLLRRFQLLVTFFFYFFNGD